MTGEQKYREAADWTLNSFKNLPDGAPWTVAVDGAGYVWFEEYPDKPLDYTLNGHIWAIYGLADYYRLTGDPEALVLTQGGLSAVRRYMASFRVPGSISRYCLRHGVGNIGYHLVDFLQLRQLYTLTGDTRFVRVADTFETDAPDYRITGTMRFLAGTHTGYRFSVTGAIVATKRAILLSPSQAPISMRRTLAGRIGTWLYVSAGIFNGYWVRESSAAYLLGIVRAAPWGPPVPWPNPVHASSATDCAGWYLYRLPV